VRQELETILHRLVPQARIALVVLHRLVIALIVVLAIALVQGVQLQRQILVPQVTTVQLSRRHWLAQQGIFAQLSHSQRLFLAVHNWVLHLHVFLVRTHLAARLPLRRLLALHAILEIVLALPVRLRALTHAPQVTFVQILHKRIQNKTCALLVTTASQHKHLARRMHAALAPTRPVAPPPQQSIHAILVPLAIVLRSVVRLHFRTNAQQATIVRLLLLSRHKTNALQDITAYLALVPQRQRHNVEWVLGLSVARVSRAQLPARHAL
jgi:hypothetical protein